MVRKTRKANHKQGKVDGIYTIPELRRSFEHIESYLQKQFKENKSKEMVIKNLQSEWKKVFMKDLDYKSAEAYVEHVARYKKSTRTTLKKSHTKKKHGGAISPLAGAPLDYMTRQGVYIQPGSVPPNAYGNILDYVSKGFWNPEPGQSYDPVPGQTHYVTHTPAEMGNNTVHFPTMKGGKINQRNSRKLRIGGSSVPAGVLQDMKDIWYGKQVGPSPDQTQR